MVGCAGWVAVRAWDAGCQGNAMISLRLPWWVVQAGLRYQHDTQATRRTLLKACGYHGGLCRLGCGTSMIRRLPGTRDMVAQKRKLVRERKHRLPKEAYCGFVVVAFTACIRNRTYLFKNDLLVREFEEILLQELVKFKCEAIVYLFMPEHCHLLLQGKHESAQVLTVMKSFKQKTGFWLSQNRPRIKWQKDFYDHILVGEEEISKHIRYILENPVRKGIVQHWKDYPYKGSTVYNLDEWPALW